MPYFSVNKMSSNRWQDREETTICHSRNSTDSLVMIFYELYVRQKRSETAPAGKRFDADQQTAQLTFLFDVRVNLFYKRTKIRCLQRALRLDNEDALISQ